MVADQTIRDADANAQGSTTMADLMAGLPPLLLGTYTPKIDAKGRMALPAKFRSQLGQGLNDVKIQGSASPGRAKNTARIRTRRG